MNYLDPWWPVIFQGLVNTLTLVFWVAILSTLLAALVGIGFTSQNRWVRRGSRLFVEVFRSIPALVLLMLLYFGMGAVVGMLGMPAYWVAVAALTLNQAAYTGDAYRAAIQSIDAGQWDAARSLGLPRGKANRLVILPQALLPAIGPTTNALVMIVKDSALASIVTVPELVLAANRVIQGTFEVIPTYAVVGAIYLTLTMPLIYLARHFDRRVSKRRVRAA
jgi:amine acid ABC transporter, permease protein, 3-TM region, His/Glu/Gln/Arg/opine family